MWKNSIINTLYQSHNFKNYQHMTPFISPVSSPTPSLCPHHYIILKQIQTTLFSDRDLTLNLSAMLFKVRNGDLFIILYSLHSLASYT